MVDLTVGETPKHQVNEMIDYALHLSRWEPHCMSDKRVRQRRYELRNRQISVLTLVYSQMLSFIDSYIVGGVT